MTNPPARRNLVERAEEVFRPPVFKPDTTILNRIENGLRRFLDLQAGSGWRDLKSELRHVSGRLIDIGCGAQVYRALLPAEVTYLGIDTSDAKAKFGYQVPDTHYFEGDDWGIEPGSFDVALCTEVLEHIQEPAPFLAKTFNCLARGGRLILTVPFAARWHFVPFDFWRYTPSSLAVLLTNAGFSDVRVTARGNPVTVACYKVMTLQLMLLFGSDARGPGILRRVMGVLLLPALGVLALVANLTMNGDWGDDCLGYTVTARRP